MQLLFSREKKKRTTSIQAIVLECPPPLPPPPKKETDKHTQFLVSNGHLKEAVAQLRLIFTMHDQGCKMTPDVMMVAVRV